MKTRTLSFATGLCAFILAAALCVAASSSKAATEDEIEQAIVDGMSWLAGQQYDDGSWRYWTDGTDPGVDVAVTGLVVVKFLERPKELEPPLDPFDPAYEYSENVIAGLDYIFGYLASDASGVHCTEMVWPQTYCTGIVAMALAATNAPARLITTGPLAGQTYAQALQGMVNWLSNTQQTAATYACDEGGWDYQPDPNDSSGWADQSNSGYASLGLGFAAAPSPAGFGLTIPPAVLTRLNTYIGNVQDPMNGDSYDGGSWYEPCNLYKWVNILKTGNLLYEMALVGDDVSSLRVQNAISYIENHWNNTGPQPEFPSTSLGWKDSYQAMFALMKGLEAFAIQSLTVSGSPIDWFDEVSDVIVANQNPDGSWAWIDPAIWEGEESDALRAAWALLTLERVVPTVVRPVRLDVKPMSCPNPLQVRKKGVLPVAIVGTEDFDVSEVDAYTVQLEGVSPLRSDLEDVATPFEPATGKEDCLEDCTEAGPDGFMDLTLKFSAPEIVSALGEVADRECRVVTLTGELLDGTPITGEDVVIILMGKEGE